MQLPAFSSATLFSLILAGRLAASLPGDLPEPLGHWTFDELKNGETKGTGRNVPAGVGTGLAIVPGKIGKALAFLQGSRLDIPLDMSPEIGGPITVSFWFEMPDKVDQYAQLFDSNASGGINLRVNSMHCITLAAGSEWHLIKQGAKTHELGDWVHLVATYDGSIVKLYDNGKLVGEKNPVNPVVYGKIIHVGYIADLPTSKVPDPEPRHFFEGAIDDLQIFDRALTEEEIQKLETPKK